jgi:predicted nucleotidyltransferase
MVRTNSTDKKPHDSLWYCSPKIPMSVIRNYARQVAERFEPERIILFGSFAYGSPHADSDVDILVIMPARNEIDQSVRISLAIEPPFPLDLIVRTPKNLNWRLKEGDWFLREVVGQGKVLYEKADGRVGPKSRSGLRRRNGTRSRNRPIA